MTPIPTDDGPERAATGIAGLDEILRGGFPRAEMHLLEGTSGTGKTTLALQFLLEGACAGEAGAYVTLSQTRIGLETIARSHGWSLDTITVHELQPDDALASLHQTVLHTAEVELGEMSEAIRELVARTSPRRIVFDSIGVIGLLAGSSTRYRREIVRLRQFLASAGCTALFISDRPSVELDGTAGSEFHSLSSSIVHLEETVPDYGEVRRRLRVLKVRGVSFRGGYHNFRIRHGGLEVFPRLELPSRAPFTGFRFVPSGLGPLDDSLGGGLELGTTALLTGPPGAGKSTLASAFLHSAARAGDKSIVFLFDERPETFLGRSESVGLGLRAAIDRGAVTIRPVEIARITPGEFAERVRRAVDEDGVKIVLIDSLVGYFSAMTDLTMLPVQIHELLHFLGRSGVLTLLLLAREGIGPGASLPVDPSYLADTILSFRPFEADGRLRRSVVATKKRHGEHETTIRELFIGAGSVRVGNEPLSEQGG